MSTFRELRARVAWRPAFANEHAIFAALAPFAAAFEAHATFPPPEVIDERLSSLAGVRFARAATPHTGPRREADLYDGAISERRAVPTRDGSWHDLLNALVWCLFPRAKSALHRRQYELVRAGLDGATGRLPGERTREQDALALFDEGGLVVRSNESLATGEAIEAAVAEGRAGAIVFGHAIYEGFVLGARWPTVRAIVVPTDDSDGALAARLTDPSARLTPDALPRVALAAWLDAPAPARLTPDALPPT